MLSHLCVTDHFGGGVCVYRAKYPSPETYTGDCLEVIRGPFPSWESAEKCAESIAQETGEDIYTL